MGNFHPSFSSYGFAPGYGNTGTGPFGVGTVNRHFGVYGGGGGVGGIIRGAGIGVTRGVGVTNGVRGAGATREPGPILGPTLTGGGENNGGRGPKNTVNVERRLAIRERNTPSGMRK
jgi:hypothetical protein